LSTLPNAAVLFPDWKQEVNRRVAARSGRRAAAQEAGGTARNPQAPAGRAATAARVAARYANAPSYSEELTREARAAVDAAKAAAQAAEEAQAAFQYVLDGLEASAPAEPARKPEPLPARPAAPDVYRPHRERREPATREPAGASSWERKAGGWQDESAPYDAAPHAGSPAIAEANAGEQIQPGEMVKPIYANLIEFPRPMVAARRARPRRAEGPLAAAESAPQLSIFEVDASAISIEPAPATVDPMAPPSWMRSEWTNPATEEMFSAMQPVATALSRIAESLPAAADFEAQPDRAARREESLAADFTHDEPATQAASAPALEVAPFSSRLLAMVVDCALSAAAAIAVAMLAGSHMSQLPGARTAACGLALALVTAGSAYYSAFLTLSRATPGMRYAGIEIDSFAGFAATRAERSRRLMALPLSVLPLGLGLMWALFDDGGLAWHDRLSRTYLRRR
jgi:uncharacterized RDD family membrane protein YckC